ncbi:hypothetical protein [Candidatus Erwinia haradaeae]|uniref:hypothetical protein n=1 Tax=Candidatus Erwinia haradaeae TaxID=1922217 RepID=UPI00130077CF|nr:hypothetical protein [Candidatus Erwinia haradaeae]
MAKYQAASIASSNHLHKSFIQIGFLYKEIAVSIYNPSSFIFKITHKITSIAVNNIPINNFRILLEINLTL